MSEAITLGFGFTLGLLAAIGAVVGAVVIVAAAGGLLVAAAGGVSYLVELPARMAAARAEEAERQRLGAEYRTRREIAAKELEERDARFWADIPKQNIVTVDRIVH